MKPKSPLTKPRRIALLVFGVVALISGIVLAYINIQKIFLDTARTEGLITDVRIGGGGARFGSPSYYYVAFTLSNQTYTSQQSPTFFIPLRHRGDKVEVMYNPNKPEEAFIGPSFLLLLMPMFVILCGAGLLAIALKRKSSSS